MIEKDRSESGSIDMEALGRDIARVIHSDEMDELRRRIRMADVGNDLAKMECLGLIEDGVADSSKEQGSSE